MIVTRVQIRALIILSSLCRSRQFIIYKSIKPFLSSGLDRANLAKPSKATYSLSRYSCFILLPLFGFSAENSAEYAVFLLVKIWSSVISGVILPAPPVRFKIIIFMFLHHRIMIHTNLSRQHPSFSSSRYFLVNTTKIPSNSVSNMRLLIIFLVFSFLDHQDICLD